jgi:hypothetical protein
MRRLEQYRFLGETSKLLAGSKKQEVLVFIHGYNNSFSDAARRWRAKIWLMRAAVSFAALAGVRAQHHIA